MTRLPLSRAPSLILAAAFAACGEPTEVRELPQASERQCLIREDLIVYGGVQKDGIPSLENPPLVGPGDPGAAYLDEYTASVRDDPRFPRTRVVGVMVDGQPVAVPHNILWHHEIVNLDIGDERISVTYCPLTGSAIVFDRAALGAARLGVSGLLFQNNLIMYDPETESLWPQMMLGAQCGPLQGTALQVVPSIEMLWHEWRDRHPNTRVVSSNTGHAANYVRFPYYDYESTPDLIFSQFVDDRLDPKERVLGIPDGSGGMALAFSGMEREQRAATTEDVAGRPVLVLWDRDAAAARAYEARTDIGPATVRLENGVFVDDETGSTWNLEGRAVQGPRTGEQLVPITDSFVAFWFAWSAFHPGTRIRR